MELFFCSAYAGRNLQLEQLGRPFLSPQNKQIKTREFISIMEYQKFIIIVTY